MGKQQSGILNLRIADIVKDVEILKTARSYAVDTLKNDPNLENPANSSVRKTFAQLVRYRNIWNYIS